MRRFTRTTPLPDALALMRATARPTERTTAVSLDDAAWRVLAQPVSATRDVPPFHRAAMDGYAVRAADTEAATATTPAWFVLAGVVYTGET